MAGNTSRSVLRRVATFVASTAVVALVATGTAVTSWAAARIQEIPPASQASLTYGPEPHQILDITVPDPDRFRGRRPVIVYLHAGGWISGARTDLIDAMRVQVDR